MDNVVKVGPKGRHLKIPDGWKKVKEGVCEESDMYADLAVIRFLRVDNDDVGCPYDWFDCLIRKATDS